MQTDGTQDVDLSVAESVVNNMGRVDSGDVIPLLQKLQDSYGYLPPQAILKASELTDIPASQLYGVATFYAQFHLKPRGRHIIRVCRGTACHVRGSSYILERLKDTLGVGDGETTPDLRFTLEVVACLGTCFLAPVLLIDNDYHAQVTTDKLGKILKQYD